MAQSRTTVQLGVATSNDVLFESLEVGATTGKNRLVLLVETFNEGNDFTVNDDREYFGGIRYTRGIAVGKHLDFLLTGAAKMHIDEDLDLEVEPGVGLGLNLGKNFSIIGIMSSPLPQGVSPFSPLTLKAGVGIQVKL